MRFPFHKAVFHSEEPDLTGLYILRTDVMKAHKDQPKAKGVTLGMEERLFGGGTIAAAYTLVDSKTSPSGLMVATLKRAGDVKAGSF
jgi:hypothetical protein